MALSTDLRGAPYSFSLWDVHTGAQLVSFKGNKSSPINNCLRLIDHNYFITASDNILQIWSIYNRKCQDQKLFLPGRPSTLCVSPCGNYLVVGISEMIYVWQMRSGNLLAHTQRHYQTLTVLRFSQDGTFLFSGAEDGMVLVWPFADLISGTHHTGALGQNQSRTDIGVNEPRFTWQHHSAKITDIHVANSGLCITTSIDKSVNIYSYANGRRLHCIADWPTPVWSVVMNMSGTRLFFGGQDGNIYELAISSLSLSMISSREAGDSERKPLFVGHRDRVDHLLLSLDGSMLISGSHDSTCKIWDIPTAKMLRDVKHQAPLANLVTQLVPDAFSLTSMTQSQTKPPLQVKPLKREVYKAPRDISSSKSDLFEESSTTIINIKNNADLFEIHENAKSSIRPDQTMSKSNQKIQNGFCSENTTHVDKIKNLQGRLRELYLLSVERVFKEAALEPLKSYAQLVDQIDLELPRETKTERKTVRTKQVKRKAITLDHEDTNNSTRKQKTNPKPLTNGVKKVKGTYDLFVG